MKNLLGKTGTDRITKFRGVITGVCEYISGCNQVLIVPECKLDGSLISGEWFDQQRVVVDENKAQIVLENGDSPGHDKLPPVR